MKKIIALQLLKPLHVPNQHSFNKTITPEFYPGVEFTKEDDGCGVLVTYRGKSTIIPWGHIETAPVELSLEVVPNVKKAAK